MKKLFILFGLSQILAGCQNLSLANTQPSSEIIEVTHTVSTSVKMNYFLYHPAQSTQQKMPLLLFLHGGGESGDDPQKIKKHGPPKLITQGQDFPFFVLAPQNPYTHGFWDDQAVYELLQNVMTQYPIDSKRIYLTGMSRGGYGAWRLAMNHPNTFAAMAMVCAASAPKAYASRVKHIPTKLFHGMKDKVIPVSETTDMYNALKNLKADVSITLYPDAKHDSWTQTYQAPSLYDWFLSHALP